LLYTKHIDVSNRLKELIFYELKKKATNATADYKHFYTCSGGWALQNNGEYEVLGWTISDEVEFNRSVLIWHIGTNYATTLPIMILVTMKLPMMILVTMEQRWPKI